MNGYLILSLQAARRLLKKINTDPSYKKLLFIIGSIVKNPIRTDGIANKIRGIVTTQDVS